MQCEYKTNQDCDDVLGLYYSCNKNSLYMKSCTSRMVYLRVIHVGWDRWHCVFLCKSTYLGGQLAGTQMGSDMVFDHAWCFSVTQVNQQTEAKVMTVVYCFDCRHSNQSAP